MVEQLTSGIDLGHLLQYSMHSFANSVLVFTDLREVFNTDWSEWWREDSVGKIFNWGRK